MHFKYTDPEEGWMALRKDDPERCIAFPEEDVRKWHEEASLTIEEPIRKGCWCERKEFFDFQDVVISTK